MSIDKDAKELEAKLKAPRVQEVDKGRLCNEFAKKYELNFHGFNPISGDPHFTSIKSEEESLPLGYTEPTGNAGDGGASAAPLSVDEQIDALDGKTVEEL